jgi:chloride channel protein, CIC family
LSPRLLPFRTDHRQAQRLLPVVETDGRFVGLLTRGDLRDLAQQGVTDRRTLGELAHREAITTYPDEPLRGVVYRMAEKSLTRMPVIDRNSGKFLGLVSLDDLLKARARHLEEERRRERTLRLRYLLPGRRNEKEQTLPIV